MFGFTVELTTYHHTQRSYIICAMSAGQDAATSICCPSTTCRCYDTTPTMGHLAVASKQALLIAGECFCL